MPTIDINDPDFFSRCIPSWTEILRPYSGKPELRFLEIGSLYGKSACWLLQNVLTHPSSTLTCIDLFRQSDESYAYCRLLHFPNLDSYIPSDVLFDRIFDERIAAVGGTDRVIKIISDSESALRTLPMDSYDCVYVDGSHTSRNVLTDLVLSWGLLKLGGVLIIDDYTLQSFQDNPLKNPGIGIDAFLMVFQDEHEVLHAAGQIILRKTAHRDDIWKTKAVAALTAAI